MPSAQRRLDAADVIGRLKDRRMNLGRPGVRRPIGQPKSPQSRDGRMRPADLAERIESLKQRRPERRPQSDDVIRPIRPQAALGLARQRIGGAQQMRQGVPH